MTILDFTADKAASELTIRYADQFGEHSITVDGRRGRSAIEGLALHKDAPALEAYLARVVREESY